MKFIKVVGWIFVTLFIFNAFYKAEIKKGIASKSPSPVNVGNQIPTLRITADKLYALYQNNSVAADLNYKNKLISVVGPIAAIGTDVGGDPYIVLGGSGFLDGVQCVFDRSQVRYVAALAKGEIAYVKGLCSGKFGYVILTNCIRDDVPRGELVANVTTSDVVR